MNELLSPTLGEGTANRPIFSKSALFWSGFIGGGFSALLIGAMNSRYLNRLSKDTPIILLCLVLWAGITIGVTWYFADQITNGGIKRQDLRLGFKLIGLLVWGLFAYLHGSEHRAQEHLGIDSRKPYAAVIGAIVLAIPIQMALVAAGIFLSGVDISS